jgi:hypothetical protein
MNTLNRKDFSRGWVPSSDAANCPKNGLLRMDNLVHDEQGILSLRKGISAALSSPNLTVNNLFTAYLSGTRYRMTAAGSAIFANGSDLGVTIPGTGDVQFGSAKGQIFFARSTAKYKYDGSAVRKWGIARPVSAPTVTVKASDDKYLGTLNGPSHATPDSPAWSSAEGTAAEAVGQDGTANSCMQVTPNATTGRGDLTKTFVAPVNFGVLSGGDTATDNDLIDFYVYVTEPKILEKLQLMIDVNTGNFQEDYYWIEFTNGTYETVVTHGTDRPTMVDVINKIGLYQFSITSKAEIDEILNKLIDDWEKEGVSQSIFRPDKLSAGAWSHFTIKRSDMHRVGNTTGKGWETVASVRFVFSGETGGSGAAVRFDSLRIIGGAAQPLTGTYRYRATTVRNIEYPIISEGSDLSEPINLKAQGTTVSIPADVLSSIDSQTTELWIYRFGGTLDDWYRTAILKLEFDHTSAFEIDYGSISTKANFTSDFEGLYGGTDGPGKCNYSFERLGEYIAMTSIVDSMSDESALVVNIKLQYGNTPPPDNIIGIAGPHYDRLFTLTAKMLHPSLRRMPDTFASGQAIEMGGTDEVALWVAKALGGIYVGTTKDIYRIEGDGAEYPDGTINFSKVPVNLGNPPISNAYVQEGNALVYLASDGWRIFTGSDSSPIKGDTDLLWKNQTRYGVLPINIVSLTSRFRAAIWQGALYAITPEGSDTVRSSAIHRYDFGSQKWYRYTYSQLWTAIHRELDGPLIAGNDSGTVHVIESGTQDITTDIPIVLWTPVDDNDMPRNRKDAQDFQVRIDTGTGTASVALHLDGSASASKTLSIIKASSAIYQTSLDDLTSFRQIQLRVTGNFSTFKLIEFALSFLARPELLYYLELKPQTHSTHRSRYAGIVSTIDTLGQDASITPVLDGIEQSAFSINTNDPIASNIALTDSSFDHTCIDEKTYHGATGVLADHTIRAEEDFGALTGPGKYTSAFEQTDEYVRYPTTLIGRDLWPKISCATGFEFYGFEPVAVEALPETLKYLNLKPQAHSQSRRRYGAFSITLDTFGEDATVTPVLDGVNQSPFTVNSNGPLVSNLELTAAAAGRDLWPIISCPTGFEFYGFEAVVTENLPETLKYLEYKPKTNSPNRRRFGAFSIVIDTFGQNATITPVLDGVNQSTFTVNSNGPITSNLALAAMLTGRDLWPKITCPTGFEFYGFEAVVTENLPETLKYLELKPQLHSQNNARFGGFTITLDTFGNNATVTPVLDGVNQVSFTVNNSGPLTTNLALTSAVTGRDLWPKISCATGFEFYGFEPIIFEKLPPSLKVWDLSNLDIGNRDLTWIRKISIKADAAGTLTLNLYFDGNLTDGCPMSQSVIPNVTTVYDFPFGRGVKGKIPKIVFTSTSEFIPYWADILFRGSGTETQKSKIRIKP